MEVLRIFYPSLRFDLNTPLKVADCWENEEVEIYTIVDFDPDHGKEDIEPIGMPMCMEKVQIYIKKYLQTKYEVREFEEAEEVEEAEDSTDDSSYDDEHWYLKWKMNNRTYTLYYYYGFDPFGDYWPDRIEDIDSFIHTNGSINLEEGVNVELLQERCEDADVYATLEIAKKFWPESEECFEFADDEDVDEHNKEALYYLDDLHSYLP